MAEQKTEGNRATVQNAFSVCTVSGSGEAVVLDNSPNTNVLYRKTKMPAVKYCIKKGETNLVTRVDARKK